DIPLRPASTPREDDRRRRSPYHSTDRGKPMRLYEVVYILDPALDEGAVTTKLDRFHQLATAQGGEVDAVDHGGSRQLAYPVNNLNHGYYVVAQFTASPEALPEFERIVRLDDEVMRYLLVINDGEPTNGQSIVAESHRPA